MSKANSMRNSPDRAENPERFSGFSATDRADFELICYSASLYNSVDATRPSKLKVVIELFMTDM